MYDWDEKTQGLILSSFYWGYVITHLPGGILAEKFGGKYSLGLGILSTAIFTLLTPAVVVMSNGDWRWLVGLRVIEGLGEVTKKWMKRGSALVLVSFFVGDNIPSFKCFASQVGTIARESKNWFFSVCWRTNG